MRSSGRIAYDVVQGWEQLPAGLVHRDVSDVAVDSADRVYLLTREDAHVIVYEPDGSFVGIWGEGVLSARPHGITIGPDDTVYIVDEGGHSVTTFTRSGEEIAQIGPSGAPSDTGADPALPDIHSRVGSIERSAGPFNRPTALAVAANGDLFVTDGYGNARVHQFSPDGRLLGGFGEPGVEPGQFHLPHSLAFAPDGKLYVCDRENDRVQVFSAGGEVVDVWEGCRRPAGIVYRDGLLYLTELPWKQGHQTWRFGVVAERLPGRVRVFDLGGEEVYRIGGADPCAPGGFAAPHGIAVDGAGDIYIAQVTWTSGGKAGVYPPDCPTFVKLRRTAH